MCLYLHLFMAAIFLDHGIKFMNVIMIAVTAGVIIHYWDKEGTWKLF